MKKWMLAAVVLAVLPASALRAQNITGTWQGALKGAGPRDLRIVIKISLDDDKLKAVMYSIDQGGQGIPASAISQDRTSVKFAVAGIGGSYEGKLNPEGNLITGTWTQGAPLSLNLERATPQTEWAIPEPPPPPKVMPADAAPSFEVATIKPSRPDARFSLLVNRSGLLTTTNSSVADLIKFAYDLHPEQIKGGPAWEESEKHDITGKPDVPGIPNGKQLKMMVQKLLTERFQLTLHREKKELSVYAITAAKGGPKMTKNESNPNGLPGFGGGPRGLVVRNATMSEFANMLQANVVERPVVDQSGLASSRFDFILKGTPDGPQAPVSAGGPNPPPATDNVDAPPDLFTAFQQQLGLKLESTKAAVDVVMIDRVEKPSAN